MLLVNTTLDSRLSLPRFNAVRLLHMHWGNVMESMSQLNLDLRRWDLVYGKVSHDEIKIDRANAYQAFLRDPVNRQPQGAEVLDNFINRVSSAYDDTIERYRGKYYLIVAHAGVIRAVIAQIVHAAPAGLYRIKVSNGGITRIRHTEIGGILEILNGNYPAE